MEQTSRIGRQIENEGVHSHAAKALITPKKVTTALSDVKNKLSNKIAFKKDFTKASISENVAEAITESAADADADTYEVYYQKPFIDDYIDMCPGGLKKQLENMSKLANMHFQEDPPTSPAYDDDVNSDDFDSDISLPTIYHEDINDSFEPVYMNDVDPDSLPDFSF